MFALLSAQLSQRILFVPHHHGFTLLSKGFLLLFAPKSL